MKLIHASLVMVVLVLRAFPAHADRVLMIQDTSAITHAPSGDALDDFSYAATSVKAERTLAPFHNDYGDVFQVARLTETLDDPFALKFVPLTGNRDNIPGMNERVIGFVNNSDHYGSEFFLVHGDIDWDHIVWREHRRAGLHGWGDPAPKVVPAPEPGTLTILAVGLVGLITIKLKRAQSSKTFTREVSHL
jgi:hypothetical protein